MSGELPAAAEATAAASAMEPLTALAWATALLVLAAVLVLVEFLVVSWGMLLVAAVISAVVAVVMAFQSSAVAGWAFVAAAPLAFALALRIGLRWLRRDPVVVLPAEITAAAGASTLAAAAGIGPGSVGELVTDAYPTGRVRFDSAGGPVTLDVQVQGGARRGQRVRVLDIDGPVIHACCVEPDSPPS